MYPFSLLVIFCDGHYFLPNNIADADANLFRRFQVVADCDVLRSRVWVNVETIFC